MTALRYVSTRGGAPATGLSEAIRTGLAPDGGLYLPEALPSALALADESPPELARDAARFLGPFFAGDPLEGEVGAMSAEAFAFPCPLVPMPGGDDRLELFHGPTAAFKDFGARFLAAAATRIPSPGDGPRTVLVATSGDTGGAVASAFAGRPGVRVWILYPEGRIADRQEAQLTTWGDNVTAFAVEGSFDDCQRMVKAAFRREDLRLRLGLTSANSINLGRLLPQAAYHFHAARLHAQRTGQPMHPIIPTGNLGHAVAALWAKRVGAPIGTVVFALNANRTVLDQWAHGRAEPRAAVPTLANAMDVGIPSNLERLLHTVPDPTALRAETRAFSFDDARIEATLRIAEARWGFVPCPHTACALLARTQLPEVEGGWTVVATAHAAKFASVVEPLVGHPVDVPAPLAELLDRPRRRILVAPSLEALLEAAPNQGRD